jgi:hypothetical protein
MQQAVDPVIRYKASGKQLEREERKLERQERQAAYKEAAPWVLWLTYVGSLIGSGCIIYQMRQKFSGEKKYVADVALIFVVLILHKISCIQRASIICIKRF